MGGARQRRRQLPEHQLGERGFVVGLVAVEAVADLATFYRVARRVNVGVFMGFAERSSVKTRGIGVQYCLRKRTAQGEAQGSQQAFVS